MRSLAVVPFYEIRLHHDFPSRNPPCRELLPRELREGDENVHLALPGSDYCVGGKHCSYAGARGPATPVASVPHAGPGYALAHAELTDVTVSKENPAGAHQAVVVQRLHDGNTLRVGGVVGRGRDERQRCCARAPRWGALCDQRPELSIYLLVPQCSLRQLELMELPHCRVVSRELKHLMAMALQQARFRLEDHVLSTLVLIVIVDL